MDFDDGFRIGLPFFLPIDPGYDGRIQLVDNVSYLSGTHLFKVGVEYNRTSMEQQFIGFANSRYIFDSVDGFVGFATHGSGYVICSDGSESLTGACPPESTVTGPVLLYLQSATVPGVPPDRLGRQTMATDELAVFLQDTWKPTDRLTLNLGVRWEGAWHPDVFIEPAETFYAPYLDDPRFPSDGTIPDDLDNIQPRFGLVWDPDAGRTLLRLNAGAYTSRIPGLVFAQYRTTNGAFQQILFRSSADAALLGPVPAIDEQIDTSSAAPFLPDIHVADRDLELPRTWSFSAEATRILASAVTVSLSYQHARTDGLFRFVDRNAAALGSPFGIGTHPTGGGINMLTVGESTARSRYHGITMGLRGEAAGGGVAYEVNYTLAYDRSDDDNERDPFTLRYADPRDLGPEYGWSDRDRRHQLNGYVVVPLPGGVRASQLIRLLSASPVSAKCGNPAARAAEPADRICADGSVLRRNTLRRDNGFLTLDLRLSRAFRLGPVWSSSPCSRSSTPRTRTTSSTAPADRSSSTSTARSGAGSAIPAGPRWAQGCSFRSRHLGRGAWTRKMSCTTSCRGGWRGPVTDDLLTALRVPAPGEPGPPGAPCVWRTDYRLSATMPTIGGGERKAPGSASRSRHSDSKLRRSASVRSPDSTRRGT